jgi:hypothetical protein
MQAHASDQTSGALHAGERRLAAAIRAEGLRAYIAEVAEGFGLHTAAAAGAARPEIALN